MEDKKPVLNFRGANPIKPVSINQHINPKQMNTQLTIADELKVSPTHKYKFAPHNHSEIIKALDTYRNHFNIGTQEFSKMAGYWEGHFNALCTYKHKFSEPSYRKYREVVMALKAKELNKEKPVYAPTEPATINNTELTEEICINYLKATGEYKISKLETITNWVEL